MAPQREWRWLGLFSLRRCCDRVVSLRSLSHSRSAQAQQRLPQHTGVFASSRRVADATRLRRSTNFVTRELARGSYARDQPAAAYTTRRTRPGSRSNTRAHGCTAGLPHSRSRGILGIARTPRKTAVLGPFTVTSHTGRDTRAGMDASLDSRRGHEPAVRHEHDRPRRSPARAGERPARRANQGLRSSIGGCAPLADADLPSLPLLMI